MDEKRILKDLEKLIPYSMGIIIYGSHVKGYADKKSDIDVCIVKKENIDEKKLFHEILNVSSEDYDIVMFDRIPWYLKGKIIEEGKIIYAEDRDYLDFWLYKRAKIWNDMKRRQKKVSKEDLMKRVKKIK